jgi:hypothetical protein
MKRLLLLCFIATSALAQTPQVLLTWIAPTTNTDGTPITAVLSYNVYQYNAGLWAKLGTAAVPTYTVTPVTVGTVYSFRVTAVALGVESAPSAQVSVTAGQKTPSAPTGLTAK